MVWCYCCMLLLLYLCLTVFMMMLLNERICCLLNADFYCTFLWDIFNIVYDNTVAYIVTYYLAGSCCFSRLLAGLWNACSNFRLITVSWWCCIITLAQKKFSLFLANSLAEFLSILWNILLPAPLYLITKLSFVSMCQLYNHLREWTEISTKFLKWQ